MEDHAPRTSRRHLVRGALLGAAAFGLAGAGAPHASAQPEPRPTGMDDYPGARWTPASPSNYSVSSRPDAYPIDFVVVHVTQETYADTIKIFQNSKKKVSAHYVVRSVDGLIGQCVREKDIGWHAGNWDYNTRSVGIEHEGWVDKPEYFTDALYRASADLTAFLCTRYGVPVDRQHIIGHNEVPGATHTDPGQHWDWPRYINLVKSSARR
ncbi:N-acetylmuramoyl-L-alanine amidase [Streptomyces zagrosensis]|uniref:N-acetylmuramoyl-L-alanine amidase n=1 Tax=Streptomyces zagrosensis TaxID=1042984 RepID=A0A7W9Q911_9ACTN|nr:peptidoglycan recognition family protein [Streptomyces zagrosensis]MBB5935855.1 N-acetyl-anhydromuramyl-L-alanine amidase AmpD [Streptomyces zagrosensis]